MPANSEGFNGLRVAAFESRMPGEIARLIEKLGGVPVVSPSLREVPLSESPSAVDFAHRLISGQIDVVILLTGVGTRMLLSLVERHVDRKRFLQCLADATTIVRGPKPLAVMRELGIEPTHVVGEPNTWREVLATVDEKVPLVGKSVAVQEYGKPNVSLTAGLEARGARVQTVKVYQWSLPADVGPLVANVERISRGEIDVVLFTSAHQVFNLLETAKQMGLFDVLKARLKRSVVASIGPTTSEALAEQDISADVEPPHPKMGHLVAAAAHLSQRVLRRKSAPGYPQPAGSPIENSAPDDPWTDSPFLRACRRQNVPFTPVWMMRQAGRYLPEYRSIRAKTPFAELCRNPELCAQVMDHTVRRLGVDAAILFSDLLFILEPLGFQLEYGEGEGPQIANPIRRGSDVDRTRELESPDALSFVCDAVRATRAAIPATLPLIGFSGAPFTLASYAIEGGASRTFLSTKTFMAADEGAWTALCQKLVRALVVYLNAQIEAGAQAVQLFDSWVGHLGVDDYRRYVLPHTRAVIRGLAPGVPVIHFGTGNPALTASMAEAGGDVIGVDWRAPIDVAWAQAGSDRAIQGNLDPACLLLPREDIRQRVAAVLRAAGGRPGHIFNLGHGVMKETPPDHARAMVDFVHELSHSKPHGP